MAEIHGEHTRLAEMDTGELELGAVANLSPHTRRTYAALWRAHVLPRIGDDDLRGLQPRAIESFRRELADAGVPPESIRATLLLLRSVFGGPGADPIAGSPVDETDG